MSVKLSGFFSIAPISILHDSLIELIPDENIISKSEVREEEFTIDSSILYIYIYLSQLGGDEYLMNAEYYGNRENAEILFKNWAKFLRSEKIIFQIEIYEENEKRELIGTSTFIE